LKSVRFFVTAVAVPLACAAAVAGCGPSAPSGPSTPESRDGRARDPGVVIVYPEAGTLFPPEIPPPTFRWRPTADGPDTWFLHFDVLDEAVSTHAVGPLTEWAPSERLWETIKSRSRAGDAVVTVSGVRGAGADEVLAQAAVTFRTSEDEVGSPIFYREVALPFLETVKSPATYIRWRFGAVSSREQPPVVMEGLPNCANCHSFTADGSVLAMEVDSANDKGSYAIVPVEEEMVLDDPKIMTWSDYRREDEMPTFGLLPQISPDGRYVVCMVKDRSVFVPKPGIEFSQLFFPIQGILVYYDRQTREFHALPGADDPDLVQSNPTWSPDGKHIVFARTQAYHLKNLKNKHAVLLTPEECKEFLVEGKLFQYDLYRVPFNGGQGGTPEPLEGASHNGMSNFFPKFSPDGRWIVFCKAKSYMLLQPDSELYIIPASGGEARRLRANTRRMNSWHSWSPNGKWLVFSSKANTPYTQLMLTHIDDEGTSSPAVVLSHFTTATTAANIPEFVNVPADAIQRIRGVFLDDRSYARAGYVKLLLGDIDGAEGDFRKALQMNPENANAHFNMATILIEKKQLNKAAAHCREALRIDPQAFEAHLNLGRILVDNDAAEEGLKHLSEAFRLRPDDALASYHLAVTFEKQGKIGQAASYYATAVKNRPDLVQALLSLASIRATTPYYELRNGQEAVELASTACELTRESDPWALDVLAAAHAENGEFREALRTAEAALRLALAAGDQTRVALVQKRIEAYQQNQPFRRSAPFDP